MYVLSELRYVLNMKNCSKETETIIKNMDKIYGFSRPNFPIK